MRLVIKLSLKIKASCHFTSENHDSKCFGLTQTFATGPSSSTTYRKLRSFQSGSTCLPWSRRLTALGVFGIPDSLSAVSDSICRFLNLRNASRATRTLASTEGSRMYLTAAKLCNWRTLMQPTCMLFPACWKTWRPMRSGLAWLKTQRSASSCRWGQTGNP